MARRLHLEFQAEYDAEQQRAASDSRPAQQPTQEDGEEDWEPDGEEEEEEEEDIEDFVPVPRFAVGGQRGSTPARPSAEGGKDADARLGSVQAPASATAASSARSEVVELDQEDKCHGGGSTRGPNVENNR